MNLKAFFNLSYGMYLVCSNGENGNHNGFIANTVFQVTSEPQTIAVSVNKKNLSHGYIEKSRVFTVCVLGKTTPMEFIRNFGYRSGRDVDKFINIRYILGKNKVPIVLDNSISYFEVELVQNLDAGTHTIFLGKVINAEVLDKGEPMTYTYYHEVKGGKSPKNAPTFINMDTKEEVKNVTKYVCSVCGYVYDSEKGDPESGIKPGTSFEEIPADWVCPVCGAGKDYFEKEL